LKKKSVRLWEGGEEPFLIILHIKVNEMGGGVVINIFILKIYCKIWTINAECE